MSARKILLTPLTLFIGVAILACLSYSSAIITDLDSGKL
jgi:hypothetical protein